jgi:hypothetical protein
MPNDSSIASSLYFKKHVEVRAVSINFVIKKMNMLKVIS